MAFSREQAIFLAKKCLPDWLYHHMSLDGENSLSLPQIQTIIRGGVISKASVNELLRVVTFKEAWEYAFEHLDHTIQIDFLEELNKRICRYETPHWGLNGQAPLRHMELPLFAEGLQPIVVKRKDIIRRLDELSAIHDPAERSVELYSFIVASIVFWDGNKRTASLAANMILIREGIGILTIEKEHYQDYFETLQHFYQTNDRIPFKDFLLKCIKTVDD